MIYTAKEFLVMGVILCAFIVVRYMQKPAFDVSYNEKDYCNESGDVCVYHDICYGTSQKAFYKRGGSPRMCIKGGRSSVEAEDPSSCDNIFVNKRPGFMFSKKKSLQIKGTTYFSCSWNNRVDDVLVNSLVPSFRAIEEVGMEDELKSNNLKFLVKDGGKGTAVSAFKFATGTSSNVLDFESLIEGAESSGKNHICVEKMIVGMTEDTLNVDEYNPSLDLDNGVNRALIDHIGRTYKPTEEKVQSALIETAAKLPEDLRVEQKDSKIVPPECTVTLRLGNIKNEHEVMVHTTKYFEPPLWDVQIVQFDDASFESQYITMQTSMIYISAFGPSSYMEMFLQRGSSSLELGHSGVKDMVHESICALDPELYCMTSPSKILPVDDSEPVGEVFVDYLTYIEMLRRVRRHMVNPCVLASWEVGRQDFNPAFDLNLIRGS